ncbi:MAG: ATP-binding protein [Candidatus Hatepunaea meridiana]|nr:ATP-binding protein [Candidatus Hatepunaea meridiana]
MVRNFSKKLYTMLLDAIPSSVLLINEDMSIISANRYFIEKSQRSLSTTIGYRLEDVFPAIILENLKITSQIRQVFKNNKATDGQKMTYRAPGLPLRTFYYTILPFKWEGNVESVMLLMIDVTDQVRLSEEVRRVERQLASVVDSASDIVLSTDTDAKILTWNPAAEKVFGYTYNEANGKSFFDYITDYNGKEIKKVFNKTKTGTKSQMIECSVITKRGIDIQVSWVISPMKNDFSRTIGIVAVGRDLTEQRKLEMQIRQSQKLTALGVMAGGIAHEIRNPLAIASSSAQFLLEEKIKPEFRKECAKKIHTAIHRASFIIENLLKFARAPIKTDMEKVNLLSLIHETLSLISNQAKIQKIDMRSHFLDEVIIISGNTTLLQQMFMNLFLNAINAMPDGGNLIITEKRMGSEVLVSIEDTGRGIPKAQIEKIFDPFYTTSPVGKGTGLGLSICYSIAKQHFGSIEVDSVPDKGTIFIVRLPTL